MIPRVMPGDSVTNLFGENLEAATAQETRALKMRYNLDKSLLSQSSFENPEDIFDAYPHRLSGGMRQRALMALAISSEPDLLIADEPTKGLDTVTAQEISKLLHTISDSASLLFITHS